MMKPMRSRRVHYGWVVAGAGFTALLASAAFRAVPGVLMVPLQDEFGWSRATISAAVAINLVVFGLSGPFSAALVERIGLRRVVTVALGADRRLGRAHDRAGDAAVAALPALGRSSRAPRPAPSRRCWRR